MKTRSAFHLALTSTALMAAAIACSAPDPGQVTFTQRVDQGPGTSPTGTGPTGGTDGGPGGGGGTDGGGGATDSGTSGGTGAWAGAPPYAAGQPSGGAAAKGQAGHASINATKDPTGMNCVSSACHGVGGASSNNWGFAGTAYIDATTRVGAGIEIRVIGADGKQFDSVYTDADGNFWSPNGPAGFPTGAAAGARDGTTVRSMPLATLQCNNAGCHANGANPMMHK